jgi:integrase
MFDARAAKGLKAGDHLTVVDAPGLRLVATAKRRTWTYRYKSPVDGRMRQVALGQWPAMGFPAALAAWERARAARNAGGDLAAEKRERRQAATAQAAAERYTVRKACAEYLAAYRGNVVPKTYAEAERLFDVELASIADLPAADLTRAHAFDLLDAMRERPRVASRLRQLLGAVWDRSLDAGRLPPEAPNWWRLVLRGKLPSRGKTIAGKRTGATKRVLTDGEVRQLLPWLPNFSRDVDDALVLYLWTCCRGAEIMAMERAEISEEPDGLWWTVPKAKLKMRRNPQLQDLRVPLVGRAEAVVRRRLAAHDKGWIFPSVGRTGHVEQKAVGVAVWSHMPYAGTRKEWGRPRLPVTHWAPHDLRRTGRTMLAALGCPDGVAEAILGHLPPGVQGAYNRHGYDAERRVWLTRLAAHLEQLAAIGR